MSCSKPNMNLIRSATENDIAILAFWMNRLIAHIQETSDDPYVTNLESGFDDDFGTWFQQLLKTPDARVLIADYDQSQVGFIVGTLAQPFMKSSAIKRIGQIDLCWVESEYRRRGIGAELLKVLEMWFRHKDVKYVDLQYMIGSIEAEKTWISLGYKPYRVFSRKKL